MLHARLLAGILPVLAIHASAQELVSGESFIELPSKQDGLYLHSLFQSNMVIQRDKPVHFRYAWARNPMGNIQLPNNSDVPLATQRSDDWDGRDVPVMSNPEHNDRQAKSACTQAMKAADIRRRLHQARELIEANP